MRNKLLLEVSLPATGENMELLVPRQLQVGKVREMLTNYLRNKDGAYLPSEDAKLIEPITGKCYEPGAYLTETDLTDGSEVLFL